jgi:MHS family proline/betaine transporter-like MFS transporter
MENKNKRVCVASLGTFLEWAEFTYYAYIATKVAQLFFPNLNANLALLATFSVFAIGYFFRPMGALCFGYIGDKFGRRIALQLSISLMGLASVIIGCLPTYNHIGMLAPILLLVFRSVQGFAVSGELNGSAIYLIEHDNKSPYLAGSWAALASAAGMMFGSFMAAIIYLPNMPSWAWRIPFLLGALSCFCASYFRSSLSESPDFLRVNTEKNSNPISLLLTCHKKSLAMAAVLITPIGVYLYTMSIYYGVHLMNYTTLSQSQAKIIMTFGQGLVVICIALLARHADKYDGKKMFTYGLIGFFIAAPLAYLVPLSNSFTLILLTQIGYAVSDSLISVPIFKLLNDLFPVQVRYSGVSFAWSSVMAVFGGTTPLIANYLHTKFENPLAPVSYVLLITTIALVVLYREKGLVWLGRDQKYNLKNPHYPL